jgi:hypothetical protein
MPGRAVFAALDGSCHLANECDVYFVGTRAFSSSVQCSTTTMLAAVAPDVMVSDLIIRNCWPSAETS